MRKLFCIAALLAVVSLGIAADGTINVGTTSVKVMNSPVSGSIRGVQQMATNTVYQEGELVRSNGRVYFLKEASGTSTNVLLSGAAGDIADGTNTWRSVLRRNRKIMSMSNNGSTNVWVSFDPVAVSGEGLKLGPGASLVLVGESCPQASVSAVAEAGTVAVGTLEY